jgi:hypothetical protein
VKFYSWAKGKIICRKENIMENDNSCTSSGSADVMYEFEYVLGYAGC